MTKFLQITIESFYRLMFRKGLNFLKNTPVKYSTGHKCFTESSIKDLAHTISSAHKLLQKDGEANRDDWNKFEDSLHETSKTFSTALDARSNLQNSFYVRTAKTIFEEEFALAMAAKRNSSNKDSKVLQLPEPVLLSAETDQNKADCKLAVAENEFAAFAQQARLSSYSGSTRSIDSSEKK